MNINPAQKHTVVTILSLLSLAILPDARAQTDNQNAATKSGTASSISHEKAQASDADLAKQLQNPVSDLISVPLENRLDFGPGNTKRYTMSAMPVIPIDLTPDWLLVSRTILPVVCAQKPVGEPALDEVSDSAVQKGPYFGGLGDTTQSFFLAPRQPMEGWIWGAGPVFRLPTATQSFFGAGKWGLGPTGVALRQDGPWTYGLLANHIWSFAGWGPQSVNSTYLQPFLAYTTDTLTTFGLGSESGYSWTERQWVVPLDVSISQVVEIGKMPVSIGLSGRYYAARPSGGPNFGLTLTVTLVFPTK